LKIAKKEMMGDEKYKMKRKKLMVRISNDWVKPRGGASKKSGLELKEKRFKIGDQKWIKKCENGK
jgi:hypothetical protein